MSLWRLIFRSAAFYRATNLAVLAGVAVAAAVLVGSLVVGDSVKGSLHDLALERIGSFEWVLERPRAFPTALGRGLADFHISVQGMWASTAFVADGTARTPEADYAIPHVQVVAADGMFFALFARGGAGPDKTRSREMLDDRLTSRQAIINEALARELKVKPGDAVILTLPKTAAAPVESVFGRRSRDDVVMTVRVIVKAVIPDSGPGRFTLRADRPRPRTVFLSLDALAESAGASIANTVFVAPADPAGTAAARKPVDVAAQIRARALYLRADELGYEREPGRLGIRGDSVAIAPPVVRFIQDLADNDHAACELRSVYLANGIRRAGATDNSGVPYSLIAGVESLAGFESANDRSLPATLGDNDIVLNLWAAQDIGVSCGDVLRAEFYVAGPRGAIATVSRDFTVAGVVRMRGAALDRDYVPVVRGMTDAKSMSDWAPPFPIDLKRIRQKDEDYWDKYHATPKAFVSLDAVRSLWTHGIDPEVARGTAWVTGVRVATRRADGTTLDADRFIARLRDRIPLEAFGFTIRNVRDEALAAANAATDFGVLFLSMSFFLVAAAAMLIFLLMRLTIDRRAAQVGLLLAQGFTPRAASRVLVREALLVSVAGVIVGVPLGIGYARAILWALRSGWSGAVADFPLALHVSTPSVVIGAVSGLIVAAFAVALSARMLRRLAPLVLLSGWQAIAAESRARRGPALALGILTLAGAGTLLLLARFEVVSPPAAFGAAGPLLLISGLALFAGALARGADPAPPTLSLTSLALRSASRHRGRSLLTAALLACAALVLVTVAAFRRDPTREHPGPRDSGTGGFSLFVRADLPVFADINTPEGRKQIGFTRQASDILKAARIYSLRETRGDDISCLNLRRSKAPRVVGVPDHFSERGGFAFGALTRKVVTNNPWVILLPFARTEGVPAFADADTAQWQMHVGIGDNVTVPAPGGRDVSFEIVGLMPASLFAGELVISEGDFVRAFGTETGYRVFLVECSLKDEPAVADALRASLSDFGIDVQRTTDVLAGYARVQNTYLSAFQTLGGLGLVLGTFGVVTVLLRSVVERRSELAMMLALGFTASRIRGMLLIENALLLALGVFVGTVSALVASGPQLASSASGIQWASLALTVGGSLAVGLVACVAAVGAAVGKDVIGALRSE